MFVQQAPSGGAAMSVLIFFLLLPLAEAQTIKPECSAAEIEILRSEKIRTQFIWDRSLNSIDCFYVQKSETERLIWFLVVTNTSAGLESYLALFDGKGFSESSLAIFKSRPLGFDLFPISVNGQFRLGFVHPKSTLNKLSLFINAQTSPGTSQIGRAHV